MTVNDSLLFLLGIYTQANRVLYSLVISLGISNLDGFDIRPNFLGVLILWYWTCCRRAKKVVQPTMVLRNDTFNPIWSFSFTWSFWKGIFLLLTNPSILLQYDYHFLCFLCAGILFTSIGEQLHPLFCSSGLSRLQICSCGPVLDRPVIDWCRNGL